MASWIDYLIDLVKHSWVETNQSGTNTALTVTQAAEAGRHHIITKCDASYSSSTASGLLQIKFGSTVVAQKSIHGGGALDWSVFGFQNPDANEAVSATLAAGGSGVTGELSFNGYTTGPDA